jgi:hypothetical protein
MANLYSAGGLYRPARIIKRAVKRLFKKHPPVYGQLCRNPVTGGLYVGIFDPTEEQTDLAGRMLLAREWFYLWGPPDAPPLPLADYEHDRYKYKTPLKHLVSDFAKSLRANNYDFRNHPNFEEFARGVMASEYGNPFVKKSRKLRKKYPPRSLPGIELGPIWQPNAHYKSYLPRPIAEIVLGPSWLPTKCSENVEEGLTCLF